MRRLVLNRFYWFIPISILSLIIILSLHWNLREAEAHSNDIVLERARLVSDIIASLRYWSANHVETSSKTIFFGDVHSKEEPASTTSLTRGKFTRQFTEILNERNGIVARLTSLSPLNPDNAAQPWEEKALKLFESDSRLKEWSSFASEDSVRQFRYIAPLKAESKCLECHTNQKFNPGDVAGGISVQLLSGHLLVSELEEKHHIVEVHLALGLALSILILFALSRHRSHLLNLNQLMEHQEELVNSRTAQLQQEVLQREEAQERLGRFIESTAEGLLVIDHKGCCTLANSSAIEMLGYKTSSQLLGKPIIEFLCPHYTSSTPVDTQMHCQECVIKIALKSSNSVFDEDHYFRRADGTKFPVSLTASPIFVDGHTLGSVVTFINISERKNKELALRTLSLAVEYSPAATIITDSTGRIQYVNRQFSESSGYSFDEVIGKTPGLMQSGKTTAETYTTLWKYITSGRVWHGELLNRKKDGTLFWEEISISPINDDDGNITHFVAVKEDINERKLQAEETWRLANFDGLTGLMNRHYFLNRLASLIAQAQRYEQPFALLFIDLDGFKSVNDSLGHDAGDALLKVAANRLKCTVRKSDTVARLGGDEFTLIIPMTDDSTIVEHISKKLLNTLSQPINIKGHSVTISASIGIASFPAQGLDADELLNHADTAMYSAKKSGKNRYCWYQA